MTVKAGDATGMSAIVTTKTKEGIILETECIGKVYSKEDYDKNEWTIEGEPNTTIVVARPQTVELTCATVVNRIPDVINAKPGYMPTEQSGETIEIPQKGYKTTDGQRGNLIAQIKIVVPDKLTAEEKEMFKKLKEISKFNPKVV